MSFPLPSDHDELDKLWARSDGSMCLICHMFETFDGVDPFDVCFECGHVYRTGQDMIDEYNAHGEWEWEGLAASIPFCPMCLHDF